jgi:hypothetical protein
MFAILLAVGIVQIYVDCRYPKFEKYKRTLHYYNRASAQYPSAAAKAAAMSAYAPPQPGQSQYAPGTGMYAQFASDQYSQVPAAATAPNGAVMSV